MAIKSAIADRVFVGGRNDAPTVSISRRQVPPSIAPVRLPKPPIVAATNALMPMRNPMLNEAKNNEPSNTPAGACHEAGDQERNVVVVFTLMPMSCAASGSCAAACIATPSRVWRKNSCKRSIIVKPRTTIQMSCGEMAKPWTSIPR